MNALVKSISGIAVSALLASNAMAAPVTWGIVTDYYDMNGTISFDDAPIAGLSDGDFDGSDTHIYNATLNLLSTDLSIDHTQIVYFQPLTNTFDNKHIDTAVSNVASNLGSLSFLFYPSSDQGSPAVGVSEYWLSVNGSYSGGYHWAFTDDGGANNGTNLSPVPVPAAAWLFGSALLGFAGWSRRKHKAA